MSDEKFKAKLTQARKNHKCESCGTTIKSGYKYYYQKTKIVEQGVADYYSAKKECRICVDGQGWWEQDAESYQPPTHDRKQKKIQYLPVWLYKNGINAIASNQNGVLVSYDWYIPLYITKSTMKFRWKGSREWTEKGYKIRKLTTKLRHTKYKGLTVEKALLKDPDYMRVVMDKSDCIFMPECYFLLGLEKFNEIVFPFGKHKTKTISEVVVKDRGYVEYLYNKWTTEKNDVYFEMEKQLGYVSV